MRTISIFLALTVAPASPALAHTGVGQADSFASGMAHPLSGADHILAMVTVGLWGTLAGGRAIWAWPASFVAMTLTGFVVATCGLQMPFVEPTIRSSVVILALLVALAVKPPVWFGAATAGLFALFHGHAHGLEAGAADRKSTRLNSSH